MDIICAKCGRHFNGIEAAREHSGHCRETSKGEDIHWLPSEKSKLTPEEWDALVKAIEKRSLPMPNRSKEVSKSRNRKIPTIIVQDWLIALVLIFALSSIGLAINIWIGSSIPLWLLFGFSFIYSVERWFFYATRKYKSVGILYRVLLNFSILSLFGLLVWSGIRLFSQQLVQSSLAGSLIFFAELIFFIWMWRVVSRNSWRWPSMKLTIFSLACLIAVFAFAGVSPLDEHKDTVLDNLSKTLSSLEQRTSDYW